MREHPHTIGRKLALQYLFMHDLLDGKVGGYEEFLSLLDNRPRENCTAYGEALVQAVLENKDEIDCEISRTATNWRVSRMPIIDRNVIRLAIAEMASAREPRNSIINEAVELARTYSGEESAKFVNGIIDKADFKMPVAT